MAGDDEHPARADVPGQAVKGQLGILAADPQLAGITVMAASLGHVREEVLLGLDHGPLRGIIT
jgi:hypothetical protein